MTDVEHALLATIVSIIQAYPKVKTSLRGRARWLAFAFTPGEFEGKTVDYYRTNLERLVRSLYKDQIGGEFIDVMANLISGQLRQAVAQAWKESGEEGELPQYLTEMSNGMILNEYTFVDQFYRDIVDARVDETSIEPLLVRAGLWANRWNDAYNSAVALIATNLGQKMRWEYGDTEHCETCLRLNGIVAFAAVWNDLKVHPQAPPNLLLECGGWRCKCKLVQTDERVTPKARAKIASIVGAG